MKVVNVNVSNTYLDALKRLLDEINLYGDSLQEKCVLIVPDNFSLNAEKLFFEYLDKEATFNVEFLTFSRLANSILKEQNISVNLINKTTGILLLTKIIYENKNELKLFGKMGLKNGVVEELYNTINQFKSSYISPEEIVVKDDNSLLSQKLHDIKFLYNQFELQLLHFGQDGSNRLNMFCKEIPNSETIKNTRYFFGYFQSFTYQQQMVLINLIKHAKSVSFGVSATTFQENSSIYLNENLQRVLNVCKEAGVKANIQNFLADLNPAINHIVKNAYSYNNKKFALDGKENLQSTALPLFSVKEGRTQNNLFKNETQAEEKSLITQIGLVEASDIQDEVEFVAKQIKSDLYFKDLDNKNIQVAVCDLETYAPIIEEIFTKFGFDFYISKNEALKNSFLIRDLRNLVDLITNNFQFKNYFAFLKSSLMQEYFCDKILEIKSQNIISSNNLNLKVLEHLNGNKNSNKTERETIFEYYINAVQKFENYALKFGLNYNLCLCSLDLEENNPHKQSFEEIRNLTNEILLGLLNGLTSSKTAQEYSNSIINFYNSINIEQTINKIVLAFNKQGDFYHEKITQKAYKNMQEVLNNLSIVFGDKEIEMSDYFSVLFAGIENLSVSLIPVGANQIYVAEANSNSFSQSESLYVLGADINSFPSMKSDLGILSDNDIANLNCKKNLEPTIREINKKEKYTCFELLSLAKGKLILTYPLQKNGTSQIKAEIFNILSNSFTIKKQPLAVIKTANILSSIVLTQDENRKNYLMASHLGNKYLAEKLQTNSSIIKSITNNIYPKSKYAQEFKSTTQIKNAKPLFFGDKDSTSVSKIETFYTCPYKHFLQYGIRLQEREVFDIRPLDIGNVMHKIVEIFVKKLVDYKMRISKQNFIELIEDIFERVCLEKEFNKLNSNDYVFVKKSLFYESVRVCDAIYYQLHNSSFKPETTYDIERAFSYEIDSVKINGKIDRIDSFENMIRLIDYKTGKSDFSLNEIYYGNKLQLMIYALAISELLNKQVAGVFYFPVKNSFTGLGVDKFSMYKLSGTYLNSVEMLQFMDNTINPNNTTSKIVKGKVKENEDGVLELDTYTKNSCLAPHEFLEILIYAKQMFIMATNNIKKGFIQKNPCARNGFSYCKMCTFNSICGYKESAPFRKNNKSVNKQSFKINLGEQNV